MTRKPNNMPSLRHGCFPAEGWPNPPHDITRDGDSVTIIMAWIDPEQVGQVPYFVDAAFDHVEYVTRPGWYYEIIAPNGWRFYMADSAQVMAVVHKSLYGPGILQAWIEGQTWLEAMATARANAAERERRRREAVQTISQEAPLDLSLDDISI